MDATISLQPFGRRSSWFSDHLRGLSTGSFRLIVLVLAAAVFAAFACLALAYRQSVQPVQDALAHHRAMTGLMQQTLDARWQVERALASTSADGFTGTYRSLEMAVASIQEMTKSSDAVDYFALSRLEQTSSEYLNTFRSLGSLIASGAPANTQATIRRQLYALGTDLSVEANASLESGLTAAEVALREQSDWLVTVASALIALLIGAFGAAFALALIITRRSAYALHQIGQAAQRITAEQYDTRIDLSGETNPDIVRLSAAFNRMAETLRGALRAESAAQQQNHAQLMKLAQQERKTAVLEERQRIARELHDSVKQQLFSITLSAGAAINLLEHAPAHVKTYLEHIQQAGHTTQSEMTTLLQELVPVSMQEKRLEDALLAYLTPLCEIHGLKLLWRVDGTNTLTIAQEHALFRAVQEAVANVVRHSGATVLHVSFYFGLVTHVIVEDNGAGFVPDAVPATSTGLALMRTRLLRVGGRYELQTTPGVGTRLTILMDLRRKQTSPPNPLSTS
jgi:NarL family two-component system sensor histidine kinase LiaS